MVKLVKIISNDPAGKSTTYLADDGNTYTLTGDLSARANNPGNISPAGSTARGTYQDQFGAIGYLPSSQGQPAVAVFPDLPSGQAAQAYLWQTPAYANKTLDQAANSWAALPYAGALTSAAGVSGGTRVGDLSSAQMQAIMAAQNAAEGSGNLKITDGNGQAVDPAIFSSSRNVTTNTAGPDDRPSMASLYGAAPPLLTPPQAPRFDSAASSLPSQADFLSQMGIGNPTTPYDPSNPAAAQHLTDMSYPVASLPPPNLPLNSVPPLPIPRPSPPASTAPMPMPTAPWLSPVVPTAPAGQNLVNLNGKMVPTGTYASPSNPGSTFTVSDDGTGKGVVTNNDPGFMNLSKMGAGTVAGGIVGKTIGDAVSSSIPAAQAAVGKAGSDIGAAASNLGSNAAAFGGSLLNGIGGLFGPKPPSVPQAPSFLPSGNSWSTPLTSSNSGNGSQGSSLPSFVPTGNNWSMPLAPPSPPPAPTTQQVLNPAYSDWQAKYGNQGGLSTGTSQNTVSSKFDGTDSTLMGTPAPMPVAPPPPPKYITQTVPAIPKSIGAPVPMPLPPWLSPVMPTSATFGTEPLSQLIAKSKLGAPIQFLGGAQNNYGYLAPAASKAGVSVGDLHSQLMAQQARAPGYYQTNSNGTPALAMNGQQIRSNPYVNPTTGMIS